MASSIVLTLLSAIVALHLNLGFCLEIHFYKDSCPEAEVLVKQIMQKHFSTDPSLPAALLRMQFHDCMVRGCDASVLLDSTEGEPSEKEASPNLTLRGFEIIDEIKSEIEKRCPSIVSCADILSLATRDGVALAGGSAYALPLGRRDGLFSNISEVHLPGPSFSVNAALEAVKSIGLDIIDLTTLLGAHAIGFCHCGFFVERLYNFKGSNKPDPKINPKFLTSLTKTCPNSEDFNLTTDPIILMTPINKPFKLDTSFYQAVLGDQAVLHLDQQLGYTNLTRKIAADYVNRPTFFRRKFAKAMIKLSNAGVLSGNDGEIRKNCRRINKKPDHMLFGKSRPSK